MPHVKSPVPACRIAAALLLISASALPMSATAQPAADLSPRIAARSAIVQRHLDLLTSPSQATRIAAFAEMTGSGDPALSDIAVEAALVSPDPAMQALGVRAGFRQVRSLVAKLAPPTGLDGVEVQKVCGDAVQYKIENYSFETGSFDAHGQDHAGVGQVNGTTVSITIEYGCSLTGKLQPDGSLAGLVSAPYKKGSLPMRAVFR